MMEPVIKTWLGKKLKDYSEIDFNNELAKTLAEVVLITGGKMYDIKTQKPMYQSQLKMIKKFLLQFYPAFTFEEINKAFYLNSAGSYEEIYSHYNRELNIEFIGQVLSGYTHYKRNILVEGGDQLQDALFPPKELPAPVWTEQDHLNDRRETIEKAYQSLVSNLDMNDELFPDYYYHQLEADGYLEKNCYEKKLAEAKQKIAHNKQIEQMILGGKNATSKQGEDRSGTKVEDRQYDTQHISKSLDRIRQAAKMGKLEKVNEVVFVSKQIIVKEFFLDCFAKGKKALYEKIKKDE